MSQGKPTSVQFFLIFPNCSKLFQQESLGIFRAKEWSFSSFSFWYDIYLIDLRTPSVYKSYNCSIEIVDPGLLNLVINLSLLSNIVENTHRFFFFIFLFLGLFIANELFTTYNGIVELKLTYILSLWDLIFPETEGHFSVWSIRRHIHTHKFVLFQRGSLF